jgi:hypothetical protein
MSECKKILKNRMADELRQSNGNKNKKYNDNVNNNKMKVDYETIYQYEPLLMENVNKKEDEPFSSKFTPII